MQTTRLGLIGFGTVGTGVVRLLQKNAGLIRERTGMCLELKRIVDCHIDRERPVKVAKEILSTDVNEILEDPTIDVVIELIGGYSPAREYILQALRNGKHVVTANKALLARDGPEIFAEAEKARRRVFYEASVGGGIPILLALERGLVGNKIESIRGILNGTCNFILTKMEGGVLEYADALKLAQEKGFAEANPRLDVEGSDAMHKLVILSRLAFGGESDEMTVELKGITHVTQADVRAARAAGKKIKLVAEATTRKGEASLRVSPKELPLDDPLARVDDEMNAIVVKGDFAGELFFAGRGAGMDATASAVVADLVEAAKQLNRSRAE
ncbi:MAG: homoserine dehydrogenase [Candidatus Diapherotrites archaeon]|uniref:Homoserine dehydrogenase n=1 Tax=Candidatus Iainarchaeum sp. TaxID=3101447 RepID=A0A8T4L873_9ARCH|nr:homoserine dehydrogenase [Candidatus Diapherotrites archaeon]